MSVGIPLPELDVTKPAQNPAPNPLQEFQRAAQLKTEAGQQAIQQQQVQGLSQQNQMQAMQLKDEQLRRQLAPQFVQKDDSGKPTGFDTEGLYNAMLQGGADPASIAQMRMKQVEFQKSLIGLQDAQSDRLAKVHSAMFNAIQGVEDVQNKTYQPPQAAPTTPNPSGMPAFMLPNAAPQQGGEATPAPSEPPAGQRPLTPQAQAAYQHQLFQLAQNNIPIGGLKPTITNEADLEQAKAELGLYAEAQKNAKEQATTAAEAGKGAAQQAEAALTNLKAKGGNMTPTDIHSAVGQVIPANWPDPTLAARTEQRMQFAQAHGDLEGVQKALKDASDEVGTVQKETNPTVQANKIATSAAEGAAKANIEAQAARGSNAQLAQVPPHLVNLATTAADKADQDYAQAKSVSDRLSAMMDAAKNGNVVSYQLIPEEGALQVTTSQGVHRINMAEIQNYGGGSLWQKMQGHIGKALTGESIPNSVLDDMAGMQKIQADGSRTKYENTLKSINQRTGATFKPMNMEDLNGKQPNAQQQNNFFSQFGGQPRQ